ncbi:protein tipE [Episyrphus balteatus]|uniref:protein tipE n=1 Tax=Episyrphus balteatus TaxID=286459 RepID=UPI0024851F93|nr:protein tipE [Episyrphus balteatus]
MGDEPPEERTFKEKLLFYTTAFFILLGTFSMFAFLFLVPFVIEPAFTTIFMQFDEVPALCETMYQDTFHGAKNCSWASCREGCTKDIYVCTQIRVNYRLNLYNYTDEFNFTQYHIDLAWSERVMPKVKRTDRYERAIRDYEYADGVGMDGTMGGIGSINFDENSLLDMSHSLSGDDDDDDNGDSSDNEDGQPFDQISELNKDLMGNNSKYFYVGARLFPNVKGCGYPPMLNCSIWTKRYIKLKSMFPCYYSKVDPSLVISELDYWQNTLNLVYSMAIPIPSFIISVIYLTYAYFKIYNEDEEAAPLDENAEDIDFEEGDEMVINSHEDSDDLCVDVMIPNGGTSLSPAASQMTPNSEINSFGHQLKVQMADDMSRESLDAGVISNSNSVQGNLSKTMTTSISTPPGPTAAV